MWGHEPEVAATPAMATEARAPADLERELRALRSELEALRQGQGRLTRQVEAAEGLAAVAAPRAPAGDTPPPEAPATAPGPAELAAREEARRERQVELEAELELAVNTEARDSEWAGRTEALIRGAFQGPDLAGSRLARVECRTRLCVLEVEHEGHEARAGLLGSLMSARGLQGQAVMRPSEEGDRLTSRVYLSRQGERLPMALRR
jgi:hypothetical protein